MRLARKAKALFAALCTLLVLNSCSNAEKRFQSELSSGRCDEALEQLPSKDPLVKLGSKTEQTAGTMASYVFVGASYTVQVLWDIVGGAVGLVAMCGPTVVVSVAAASAGPDGKMIPIHCLPGDVKVLMAPPLGKEAHKRTQKMRCPDLVGVSRSIREVATCYQNRGGDDNKAKAKQSLESVKSSKDFYECLPSDEQKAVEDQLQAVTSAGS